MGSSEQSKYDISREIWEKKYRYQGSPEVARDNSPEDTFKRVAHAIAANEKDSVKWEKEFYSILSGCKFLPGGRIIANAGTKRSEVTMFNCFVMNRIDDSIDGIFETVKESALTQKQGGGVGFDFSTIRPAGSNIKGCEASASGPLSFMQVLDSTCRTIMSAGQRRGAQMGIMRCDHPDIESFITAKRNNAALQMFNLSVAITSKFVEAVKADSPWDLVFNGKVYKTVKARELWELIMHSTYDFAEPGFILIDRINQMNNLYYCLRGTAASAIWGLPAGVREPFPFRNQSIYSGSKTGQGRHCQNRHYRGSNAGQCDRSEQLSAASAENGGSFQTQNGYRHHRSGRSVHFPGHQIRIAGIRKNGR